MGYGAANNFHIQLDTEFIYRARKIVETEETKYFVVQERDVSYRFYSHFHPYVGHLVRRLLTKGIDGLQAVDTEYAPDNASLPGSVEVALEGNTSLPLAPTTKIALLADLQAALADGTEISLSAAKHFELTLAAQATLPGGSKLTLVDGMTGTPRPGTRFALVQSQEAFLYADTRVTLDAATPLTLDNDTQATLAAGTEVLLAVGTPFSLPNGMQVRLVRSKRLPKELYAAIFSSSAYNPSSVVQRPHPVKDLDFTYSGAYAVYNWELFFHVPLTIAVHLSKNQRFAEAQHWFHYLFDPTDDSDGPTPERFWKVRPFQYTDVKKIEEILVNLVTGADPMLRDETIQSIKAWEDAPFRPHIIARYRQQAYMLKTVMAYLDNLVAWGDSLFRQDTGEAIDEAMMLYVLAANILGPRPQAVPKKASVRPQTYATLRKDLRQFGVVVRDAEAEIPFDLMPAPREGAEASARLATLGSLGKALYFCVPRNDKLLSYWDTVADRLFKIRNSLNLQGIFRQLALFEPPIDPAMLVRATAAGLDVGAIVNGMNQPLPLVRFQFLIQKAAELCQEVKALGASLLAAMEKEDGEVLALLRAKHERALAEMVEQVRYAQLQEAIKTKEGLFKSLAIAIQRYTYYERQLGKKADEIEKALPVLEELDQSDKENLAKQKFAISEPEVALREIGIDIAPGGPGTVGSATFGLVGAGDITGGTQINTQEAEELNKLELAYALPEAAKVLSLAAKALGVIPDASIKLHFWGLGGDLSLGGTKLAAAANYAADAVLNTAERMRYEANRAYKIGLYARRQQDWAFQSNLVAGEIMQIFKQLRAAQLREAIAEMELKAHRKQVEQASEIEHFLNEEGANKSGKKTNRALYAWMKREGKALYAQCFQLAFDVAKKAERGLQHELGNAELSYLQFGYLGGKEGLLAGEKLYMDIKRMEMAYYDLNQREYELVKHVSLLQVDPFALVQLRATGRCSVRLQESLFDMDGPGHYFRRIKSVAVSIPSVTGPYTSVNCTLTLLRSSIRKTALVGEGYPREDAEDARFNDFYGSLQSIVTSSGQNDSGLFETNLRDERYLPFEGYGAISEWQLALPGNPSKGDPLQFDYGTISDVILHIRYTAREGGSLLANGAITTLKAGIDDAQAVGSIRLFSIRHEFPTAWAKFKNVQQVSNQSRAGLTVVLREEHYPFWSQGSLQKVKGVHLIADTSGNGGLEISEQADGTGKLGTLVQDSSFGNMQVGKLANLRLKQPNDELTEEPTGTLTLYVNDNAMQDLWVALAWGKQ